MRSRARGASWGARGLGVRARRGRVGGGAPQGTGRRSPRAWVAFGKQEAEQLEDLTLEAGYAWVACGAEVVRDEPYGVRYYPGFGWIEAMGTASHADEMRVEEERAAVAAVDERPGEGDEVSHA